MRIPTLKTINWREKPKKWEVLLMISFGGLALGQSVWVFGATETARATHEKQLEQIQSWKEASIATAMRASASVKNLGEEDREVLSWLTKGFDNSQGQFQAFTDTGWDSRKFKRCLEVMPFLGSLELIASLQEAMKKHSGLDGDFDVDVWYQKLWQEESAGQLEDQTYADFKATLYRAIDPRFSEYFGADKPSTISLSEIRWGGVNQDGIPPLHRPKMLKASEASYLKNSDVVFALEVNGDARAYPKRILAWHEMFTDTVGGVPITGVYCTLCGSMIPYESTVDGITYQMGTSGFLYRSNKLMYDKQTKSLWSTTAGEPVVGVLVGRKLKLKSRPVVTTTWGKWKSQHPETTVLSLNTGFLRDYGEGVAYKEYFSSDELMFAVPSLDTTLKNKAEILVLPWSKKCPSAISISLLNANRIYQSSVADTRFVVITDSSGANRVYENSTSFRSLKGDKSIFDSKGKAWTISEDALRCVETGEKLPRLEAHRAFWFGWHAAYPDGHLISKE